MASEQLTKASEEVAKGMEELPLERSPYVKYDDTEDYKLQAYGTQGQLPVRDTERRGGATDGPTLSGYAQEQLDAVDFINNHLTA